MANSDNVLRGGLTSKHVDVAELLRVLDFRPCTPPVLHGTEADGWVRYDTEAAEFLLRRLDRDGDGGGPPVPVPDAGPRILLCTAGSAQVRAGGPDDGRVIERGQALWLGATDTGIGVVPREPGTRLFLASDGLDG
jgi:mannose-6-phosphate isomerase